MNALTLATADVDAFLANDGGVARWQRSKVGLERARCQHALVASFERSVRPCPPARWCETALSRTLPCIIHASRCKTRCPRQWSACNSPSPGHLGQKRCQRRRLPHPTGPTTHSTASSSTPAGTLVGVVAATQGVLGESKMGCCRGPRDVARWQRQPDVIDCHLLVSMLGICICIAPPAPATPLCRRLHHSSAPPQLASIAPTCRTKRPFSWPSPQSGTNVKGWRSRLNSAMLTNMPRCECRGPLDGHEGTEGRKRHKH